MLVINTENCCVSPFQKAGEDIIMGVDNNIYLMVADGVKFIVYSVGVELGHEGIDLKTCHDNIHVVDFGLYDVNKVVDTGLGLSPMASLQNSLYHYSLNDSSCGVAVVSSRVASLG